jgi:hypothetical protein
VQTGAPGWLLAGPSRGVAQFAAALSVVVGIVWFGIGDAAQDQLVNCNEVDFADRCACNTAVLSALAHMRTIVLDPVNSANVTEARVQILIQQEQQHRLRTLIAPKCDKPSDSTRIPITDANSPRVSGKIPNDYHLRPLGALRLDETKDTPAKDTKTKDTTAKDDPRLRDVRTLLYGRWDGWLTLSDGKASRVFLHVIDVRKPSEPAGAHYVRACSDQGMVLGSVKDGVLEFMRAAPPGLTYSIRLWKSGAPPYRDLEGVAILEARPDEQLVGGLIWLTKAPNFPGAMPPSEYPCQDRAFEDEKLTRELDALKAELERLKRQPLGN